MSIKQRMLEKPLLLLIFIQLANPGFSQNYGKITNPSYRYYANPGFTNISEITAGFGLGDTTYVNSGRYFGITNISGYQIDRNFFGGIGTGIFYYENQGYIPLYGEFRYQVYLRSANPYFFGCGGLLIDYENLNHGTKVFINPGIGISKLITKSLDLTLGAGLMVQMGDNVPRTSFLNLKIGIIYRKNQFRLYKPSRKYF